MTEPAAQRYSYVNLGPGDPAPSFRQRCTSNADYNFDSAAGRFLVLCFFGSSALAATQEVVAFLSRRRAVFDDARFAFFGVTVDPADEVRLVESLPGIRHFFDFDQSVSRLYGAAPRESVSRQAERTVRRLWVVIDPMLRVIATIPFAADGSDRRAVEALLDRLAADERAIAAAEAPILLLPNVFEADLCQTLIAAFERDGGSDSGFMREVDGKTVLRHDPRHKRRRDFSLEDDDLVEAVQARVRRRIVPQIAKAYQFTATRMERYLVACYSAEESGHFAPHRDNTTKGTAHRRFAVSVNLNADFSGGEVGFPEFGPRYYKAPPGGAVVFSCSLLHTVSAVTAGRRYAFLPFLYDEAAAALRDANLVHLGEGVPR